MRGLVFFGAMALGFFLVVWLLSYFSHGKKVPVASYIVFILSAGIALLGILYTGLSLFDRGYTYLDIALISVSAGLGILGVLWGLSAAFLYPVKRVFLQLIDQRLKDLEAFRRPLMLAKRHHNLFGWVTIAAAAGHGAYFAFHPARSSYELWTGILAWSLLLLLSLTGLGMQRKASADKERRSSRGFHLALTLGYLALLALHFLGSLFLSAALFLMAFAALLLLWIMLRAGRALGSLRSRSVR